MADPPLSENGPMLVTIPPEFEAFAREQVTAGRFPSAEAAVAEVLRGYLTEREAVTAFLGPAIEQLDRGEGVAFDAARIRARGRDLLDSAG